MKLADVDTPELAAEKPTTARLLTPKLAFASWWIAVGILISSISVLRLLHVLTEFGLSGLVAAIIESYRTIFYFPLDHLFRLIKIDLADYAKDAIFVYLLICASFLRTYYSLKSANAKEQARTGNHYTFYSGPLVPIRKTERLCVGLARGIAKLFRIPEMKDEILNGSAPVLTEMYLTSSRTQGFIFESGLSKFYWMFFRLFTMSAVAAFVFIVSPLLFVLVLLFGSKIDYRYTTHSINEHSANIWQIRSVGVSNSRRVLLMQLLALVAVVGALLALNSVTL